MTIREGKSAWFRLLLHAADGSCNFPAMPIDGPIFDPAMPGNQAAV